MSRTLLERTKDWRWWGEQVAHFVIAAAIVALSSFGEWALGLELGTWFNMLSLAIAIGTGALWEIIQNHGDTDGSLGDSIVDFGAFWAGGLLAAIAFS